MDQERDYTTRHVTEERPSAQAKKGVLSLPAAIGIGLLILVTFGFVIYRMLGDDKGKPSAANSPDNVAQQEQKQKSDEQRARKEATVKDRPFTPQSVNPAQVESIYRDLDQPSAQAPAAQDSTLDRMLHRTAPAAPPAEMPPEYNAQQQQSPPPPVLYKPGQQGNSRGIYQVGGESSAASKTAFEVQKDEYDKDTKPMFVYSKNFKGAGYYDEQNEDRSSGTLSRRHASAPPPAEPETTGTEPPARRSARADDKNNQPLTPSTTLIWNRNAPVTLYEGEFIDGVLTHRLVADTEESPVVVSVSKDLIDNSGKWVLIPTGTRAVGKSKIVDYMGASRLFVQFHRLIFPNGVTVDLPYNSKAMKALDETGANGVASRVNRHWMLQFGTALFVGVLDGLGAAAQNRTTPNSGTSYVIDRTNENFQRILDTIMQRYTNIVPTITVVQGKRINLYITDDILMSPFDLVRNRSYADANVR